MESRNLIYQIKDYPQTKFHLSDLIYCRGIMAGNVLNFMIVKH